MKTTEFTRAVLAAALAFGPAAYATTKSINANFTGLDPMDGGCSLEEVVEALNNSPTDSHCPTFDHNADKIVLAAGEYRLEPADPMEVFGPTLTFFRSVEIAGAGKDKTRIVLKGEDEGVVFEDMLRAVNINMHDLWLDGDNNEDQTGIFIATDNGPSTRTTTVTLKNMLISGFSNGALENDNGNLTVDHCAFMNNSSEGGGAAISSQGFTTTNGGIVNIKNSLFYNNVSMNGGGAIMNTGGMTIENSTFSNNATFTDFNPARGGAILIGEAESTGKTSTLSLTHVTVAENWADVDGGGVAVEPGVAATVKTSNSIFAWNNAGGQGPDFFGPSGSNASGMGPNLFTNTSGTGQLKSTGDLKNVEPAMNELDDYGGQTWTYALMRGSPAIDKGNGGLLTDQRDFFRATDGDGNGTTGRDLGAYEHDPLSQTETARLIQKSSDTHATFTNTAYSESRGSRLEANAANDFVTYAVPVNQAGTYSVSVRIEKGTNRGKFQAAWLDDNTGSFVNLGTVKDGFGTSNSMSTQTLGTVSYDFGGMKEFRFKVTGKNGSSSGYRIYFDYIKLSPL